MTPLLQWEYQYFVVLIIIWPQILTLEKCNFKISPLFSMKISHYYHFLWENETVFFHVLTLHSRKLQLGNLVWQYGCKNDVLMNVKFPRTGLYPEGVKNKISPDVDIVLTWYLRWAHFMGQTSLSKFLVNKCWLKSCFFVTFWSKTP